MLAANRGLDAEVLVDGAHLAEEPAAQPWALRGAVTITRIGAWVCGRIDLTGPRRARPEGASLRRICRRSASTPRSPAGTRERARHAGIDYRERNADRVSCDARMTEFPIGQTLDRGNWTITECIDGEAARGYFRARDKTGRMAIVPLAHYQKQAIDVAHYAMAAPRITPCLYAGRLETTLGRYDGLVEAEPAGRPLRACTLALADAIALVVDACGIVDEAHRRGIVLRGIRPELVYVDGARVTAIAPRCEELWSTSTPPSSGVITPFSHFYLAPEILRIKPPTRASDVFSLGAILAELVTGEHPFEGDFITESLFAITGNKRRPWRLPDNLRAIVDRVLAPDPAARPSAGELAQLLS